MIKNSILLTLMIAIGTSEAVAATTAQDTNFAVQAAQGGMTEVKLAALAMQKSKNPTVVSFARRMTADHTKNNAQLAAIVKSEGLMPPSDVGAANRAVMVRLQGLNGAAFDKAYLAGQVTAHKKMLALVKTEASSGSNDNLVAFAKQTAPVVQQHLGMASMDARMVASASM
jgi:putative membrane protein